MLLTKVAIVHYVADNRVDRLQASCRKKKEEGSYEKEIPLVPFKEWKRSGEKNELVCFFSQDSRFVGLLVRQEKEGDEVIR
jgi:hypothetical protein